MKSTVFLAAGVVLVSLFTAVSFGTPVYQTLGFGQTQYGYSTGSVEIYDTIAGSGYGKAKIEWYYWRDTDSWWHYAYRIFNNDTSKSPTDGISDYHLGVPLGTTSTYNKIDKFSVDFPTLAQGAPDLAVVDTLAGSSASKASSGGWMHSLDPDNRGIDWMVTGGAIGTLPIGPALWKKQGKNYSKVYAGDTSKNDNGGQYFELVSTWSPGQCRASIAISAAMMQAEGIVYGPTGSYAGSYAVMVVPVPEPATMAILGLGGLLLRRRK